MASCITCRKPITSTQKARAVVEKNERGQIIGQRHGKCKRISDRRDRNAADTTRPGTNAPSAYEAAAMFSGDRRISEEEAAAQKAQEERAKQRAEAGDERRFDDWRSAETLEDETIASGDALSLDDLDLDK